MNVSPEIVRAEMDYRIERALAGAELEHVREARRAHHSWFRRLREHHHEDAPGAAANGAPLAA
jgi:hypothetical protein